MPKFIISFDDLKLGKIVQESDEDDVKCTLREASFDNKAFFYKTLPEENADLTSFRAIHEALCGTIAHTIISSLNSTAITPNYHLVVDKNNKIIGMLSEKIPFDSDAAEGNTTQKHLDQLLHQNADLGVLTAIRFFLCDPDGKANTSFTPSKSNNLSAKLCSIDYGLAFFLFLKEQNVLLEREERRLDELDSDKVAAKQLFDWTPSNILSFALQSSKTPNPDFLTTHLFGDFPAYLSTIYNNLPSNNHRIVDKFFTDIFSTLQFIAHHFTTDNFSETIKEKISYHELRVEDQKVFDLLLKQIKDRALLLKVELNSLKALVASEIKVSASDENYEKIITGSTLYTKFTAFVPETLKMTMVKAFIQSIREENLLNKENIEIPNQISQNSYVLKGIVHPKKGNSGKNIHIVNKDENGATQTSMFIPS